MWQYVEDILLKTGDESLKSFITAEFVKKGKHEKKKRKKNKKEETEEEGKAAAIRKIMRYSSLLLQYMAAISQKSAIDFSKFQPSSPLGRQFRYHLNQTTSTTEMISNIDGRDDEKGQMILVR